MQQSNKELLTTEGRVAFYDWYMSSQIDRRTMLVEKIAQADTVEKRYAVLVVLLYPENQGRYVALAKDTGIKAASWNHVSLGCQRLTSNMLEAFGKVYPQYIVWLSTGIENDMHQGPASLIDRYMEVCDKPRIKRLF